MIISNMYDEFPDHIPIFPLSGVIYFPKTNLPLNIFEKRYLDLVNSLLFLLAMTSTSFPCFQKNSHKVECHSRRLPQSSFPSGHGDSIYTQNLCQGLLG